MVGVTGRGKRRLGCSVPGAEISALTQLWVCSQGPGGGLESPPKNTREGGDVTQRMESGENSGTQTFRVCLQGRDRERGRAV